MFDRYIQNLFSKDSIAIIKTISNNYYQNILNNLIKGGTHESKKKKALDWIKFI